MKKIVFVLLGLMLTHCSTNRSCLEPERCPEYTFINKTDREFLIEVGESGEFDISITEAVVKPKQTVSVQLWFFGQFIDEDNGPIDPNYQGYAIHPNYLGLQSKKNSKKTYSSLNRKEIYSQRKELPCSDQTFIIKEKNGKFSIAKQNAKKI